jgi:hypothetical protein
VGQSQWTFPDGDVTAALADIQVALTNGTVAKLSLINGDNHIVTVHINGKVVDTVEIDMGDGPRPSEIS